MMNVNCDQRENPLAGPKSRCNPEYQLELPVSQPYTTPSIAAHTSFDMQSTDQQLLKAPWRSGLVENLHRGLRGLDCG